MSETLNTYDIKAFNIANEIIDKKISIIEGCRSIASIYSKTSNPNLEAFLTLRAVESETDDYPVGELRKKYNKKHLSKIDIEINQYISQVEKKVFDDCKNIIQFFKGK